MSTSPFSTSSSSSSSPAASSFHIFSAKRPGSNPFYQGESCEGEKWIPSPILSLFNSIAPKLVAQINPIPCTDHPKTQQYMCKASYVGDSGSITIRSDACYSSKDKAKVEVILKILSQCNLMELVNQNWKIPSSSGLSMTPSTNNAARSSLNISSMASDANSSSPFTASPLSRVPLQGRSSLIDNNISSTLSSSSLSVSNTGTVLNPPSSTSSIKTFINALNYLQSIDKVKCTYEIKLDKPNIGDVFGKISLKPTALPDESETDDSETESKTLNLVSYQVNYFIGDYDDDWRRNKCAKILLRKAGIICEEAENLYRRLDPKLRFCQGDIHQAEENRHVEFKGSGKKDVSLTYNEAESLVSSSPIESTVCAFLNGYLSGSYGGSIFIGIHDGGRVQGVDTMAAMTFGLEREINLNKQWTVTQYFVKKGEIIKQDQKICALKIFDVKTKTSNEICIHSIYSGTIKEIYKDGNTPVEVKNLHLECLLKIDLDQQLESNKESDRDQEEVTAKYKEKENDEVNSSDQIPQRRKYSKEKRRGEKSQRNSITEENAEEGEEAEGNLNPSNDFHIDGKLTPSESSIFHGEEGRHRVGVVSGVHITRQERDKFSRILLHRFHQIIEPLPYNLIGVFFHDVDPPRDIKENQTYQRPAYFTEADILYVDSLEKQLEAAKKEIKELRGLQASKVVIEIRVASGDQLHFCRQRAFERLTSAAITRAIPIPQMKEIVFNELKQKELQKGIKARNSSSVSTPPRP